MYVASRKEPVVKRHLLVGLIVLLSVPAWAGEWKLVWADEFNEPGLPNPAQWDYETGFIRNNEQQYYTRARKENARVEDGMLLIEARKEPWKNPAYDPNAATTRRGRRRRAFADYTSASLTTRGKASWTYGRIEVRAKLPAGRGTWPAIWTLGTNARQAGWPACGEIDIMEFVGFEPGIVHANIHTKKYNHMLGTGKGDKITIADASEAFHVYAIEWDADRIDFFVDDQKYFSFRNEGTGADVWPYDKDQYLILNLAIGGSWGGQKGIDDSIFPQRYYIDYVRVYAPNKKAAADSPPPQGPTASSSAPFDRAEISRVAALLSEKPTSFGRPISDRAAWDALAATRDGQGVITAAETLLKTPMPEMTDDIYLIYSRTGSRAEADRLDGRRRGRVGTLTEAELLENQGRFLPELEKTIRSLCDEKTWVGVAHDGNLANFHKKQVTIDLYSSALAWNLATADNLLGDKLSPATRGRIRKEIQWRIFEPFHRMVEGRQSRYWLTAEHNWNSVCLAGVTGTALALLEAREERAFYILAAEKYSMNFLKGFPPDGYCGEGTGYWNYGFGHYIFLAEEIRLATGGRIDLLSRKEALAPATFGARFEIRDGIYPAFADCSPGDSPSGRIMDFLNERLGFGLPSARSGRVRLGGEGLATGMMYLFPVPAPSKPPTAAALIKVGGPRSWFDQAGILICRPLQDTSCKLATAIIGNHNGVNHNHNDVGSYIVVSDGQTLIVDPGGETYTARTFGPHRYDSNVLNSFGHSVPLVAGRMQDAGAQARAIPLKTDFTDERDALAFDIRSAYSVEGLQKLTRSYVFSREGAGSMTVTDEVAFSSPESFETALITLGQWKQTGPDTLRIEDGPAAIDVRIDTGGIDFKIVATELNEHVHTRKLPVRLAIHLEPALEHATVVVKITPAE
jgi:beta-glucanase (GH16 family)